MAITESRGLSHQSKHEPVVLSPRSFEMITLSADNLTWLNTNDDCPEDLCAHAKVRFSVGGLEIVAPDDEWTVSASAIYLLRTLERDHTKDDPVGEHLFPCCGFSMYEGDDSEDVLIVGCNNGIDATIEHLKEGVRITADCGESRIVPEPEWIDAVLNFSGAVREFYESSAQKIPGDDVARAGFNRMMLERERRHPRQQEAG